MTDAEDYQASLDEFAAKVRADQEPTISWTELEEILERNKRGQRWAASLVLTYGDVLYPTVRNGHRYIVDEAGSTGATEPSYGTEDESLVTAGTVTLKEYGPDHASIYDVRGALKEAWEIRTAATAEYHDGDEKAIHEHCSGQRQRYATPMVG